MGSSSAFTVGLLKNLKCHKRVYATDEEIAQEACHMEIDVLGNPIGKQDQYAAAYGGLNYYQFNKDGSVDVEPVLMDHEAFKAIRKKI